MQDFLAQKVNTLSKIGEKTARLLKKLEIETVKDLIFYYPFRYEDYSKVVLIEKLEPEQAVTVFGKIDLISNRRSFRSGKSITEAIISDATGQVKAIWFNQPFIAKVLHEGDEVFLSGKMEVDLAGVQFKSPNYEKVTTFNRVKPINTGRILPIYNLTEGITQKQLRTLIFLALKNFNIEDYLPVKIINGLNFISLKQALNNIHFPINNDFLTQAQKRLKFDELFLMQLKNKLVKKKIAESKSQSIAFSLDSVKNFLSHLPFTLTSDQKKTSWQIISDMEKDKPMNRLLEGDVGSGKTVVCALATYNNAVNHKQTVIMAPTEVLATQHYQTFENWFGSLGIKTALLTRSNFKIDGIDCKKKELKAKISAGEVDVIIGTHSLIQDDVCFKDLTLAVIDEQHRFGVEQRRILKTKAPVGFSPHLLSMTATPIPRTLSLVLYGDLDLSFIIEMPKGRKKIITKISFEKEREEMISFVRAEIKAGRQAFIICPLIDESDQLGVKSVEKEYEHYSSTIFPDLLIAKLHGKMKANEKEKIMTAFKNGEFNLLLATSVIEVGVDVPNATIMIIEGAERFGLAQLHQFRGRVGRGECQSYCFLSPSYYSAKTMERLKVLIESNNGLEIAEKDLHFRGMGDVFGQAQSGFVPFKLASLTDQELIKQTTYWAEIIAGEINCYPKLFDLVGALLAEIHLE